MNYPLILKDILRFRNQIKKIGHYNNFLYNILLYRYFFRWRHLKNQFPSLELKIPWITFPAIKYLENYLKRDMRVFEYGSGGSTLFFAQIVKGVISVEHDLNWFKKIRDEVILKKYNNVNLINICPVLDSNSEWYYYSYNANYSNMSFKEYVQEILNYPDNYFDIVFIDGRARTGCFIESIQKLRKGGLIVWDDTDRDRYRENFKISRQSLKKIEVPGPTPFSAFFTATTIFIKE